MISEGKQSECLKNLNALKYFGYSQSFVKVKNIEIINWHTSGILGHRYIIAGRICSGWSQVNWVVQCWVLQMKHVVGWGWMGFDLMQLGYVYTEPLQIFIWNPPQIFTEQCCHLGNTFNVNRMLMNVYYLVWILNMYNAIVICAIN